MLHNQARYIQQRYPTSANDPVWHWSKLFEGVSPEGFYLHDLDAEGEYRGHHLFIEAKPIGAQIKKSQTERLVKLAANPKHSVLLVALESSVDEEYRHAWREVGWVWIGNLKWRDPRSVQYGSVAEFKAMIRAWFKRIDALADHEARKRQLRIMSSPEQLKLQLHD